MGSKNNQNLLIGLASAATVGLAYYVYSSSKQQQQQQQKQIAADTTNESNKSRGLAAPSVSVKTPAGSAPAPASSNSARSISSNSVSKDASLEEPTPSTSTRMEDKTPRVANRNAREQDEKTLHSRIEELDKKGKALFKNKQYLEAADVFTEALDLIESHNDTNVDETASSSLLRQTITLMNNRSAMYEKGNTPELALEDCNAILEKEANHTKARTRKLRILEGLGRYHDALVEVCAIQLLFMQTNRNNLRYGLPVPPPPVPQSKMEEILGNILPAECEKYINEMKQNKQRPLPSAYTILQLLKSYTGYNQWMEQAKADGTVESLTQQLQNDEIASDTPKKAGMLLKRGRRYMYDRDYEAASQDFQQAHDMVKDQPELQDAMPGDEYHRLLEWTGMSRHFHYDLEAALAIYAQCADLEPDNALLLVKQAGVQMDAGQHEEALKLFDTALGLDPNAADALLHRSNLRMLQQKPQHAKRDLEKCVKLEPNHVMARLRLASILAAMDDAAGAKVQLDEAEKVEPNSSEVQSYRGELYFTQGEMDMARQQFEKAIALEPSNPTPYVNAAMALLNTPPPPGQVPDAPAVMKFLQQAIDVDPQFTAAYIQLGQLKLGTATDLVTAREVVGLYDQGLANCRSPEEVKELCSMRALAVAQVEAAQMLKMETFNLQ